MSGDSKVSGPTESFHATSPSSIRVMKFGGTSVGNAARISTVADLVEEAAGESRVCAVISAVSGITNLLLEGARKAQGGEDFSREVAEYRSVHLQVLEELNAQLAADSVAELRTRVEEHAKEFERLLTGIGLLREASRVVMAQISSLGERLSSVIVAALLESRGLHPLLLDPRKVIIAAGDPLEATPRMDAIRELFSEYRTPQHRLLVLPGFFGSDADGKTVCLGRGGSDYSAAIAAAALDSELLEIWTDVDGIFSADPRMVPDAFPLPEVSFEEAMELAYFGAKVLHPKTIQPARDQGIPVRVRNSFQPSHPGTLVQTRTAKAPHAVRALTLLKSITLLNLTGSGMAGVPGVAARAFGALAKADISVILITQGSSECSITMCVAASDGTRAVQALEKAFEAELHLKRVDAVESRDGLAVLSLVGEGMRTRMGVSATLFQSLAQVAVNVVAIAQGSSERNISVVIEAADGERALRHAHRCFFEGREVLEIYLFGVGTVGSALLKHVARQRQTFLKKGLELRLVGLSNSKNLVLDSSGLELATSSLGADRSGAGSATLERLMDHVRERRPVLPVFVDCTSDPVVAKSYGKLMEAGFHIVTANKKANSTSLDYYRQLRQISRERQRRFLYETNVCAGLPVIDSLQNLVKSGDRILRLEGILSGSISFLMGRLEEGIRLSEAVREAREKGFTEPDPRDDLDGQDVGRKLLILAREIGLELEPEDVKVEGLLPGSFNPKGSVDEFMQRLPELDDSFEKRIAALRTQGKVLRFIATIEGGGARVGLREVDQDHPLAGVKGGENALSILSEHYQPRPLVIRGYGAGADVTASGVFSDVLRLATWSFL